MGKTETRVEGVIGPAAEPDPVEDLLHDQEDQDPTPGGQDQAHVKETVTLNQNLDPNHKIKVALNPGQGQSLDTDQNLDLVPSREDQTESQDLLPGRDQNPEADRSLAQSKEKSPNQGHALNQNQDPSLGPDQGLAQDHPHEDRRGPDLEVLEMETRKQDQSLPRMVMQLMEKLVTMVLINFFSKNNCLWQ